MEKEKKHPMFIFEVNKHLKQNGINYGSISFIKNLKLRTSKIKFSNVYKKIHHNQEEFILGMQEWFHIKASIHKIHINRFTE